MDPPTVHAVVRRRPTAVAAAATTESVLTPHHYYPGIASGWRVRLAPVALAALLLLAGCASPADRTPVPIEGSAATATVSDDALAATGFEQRSVSTGTLERSGTLTVQGDVELDLNYRVRAETWRAVYERRGDDGRRAVFAVWNVPLVSPDDVAATIDPVDDRSPADRAAAAQECYGLADVSHTGNRTATVLGAETTVERFAATGTVDGGSIDVVVSVASVRHDGDVVTAVAVVPADADDWATVERLLAGVTH